MDFSLSDEQRMVLETARDFAEREVRPRAAAVDAEGRFPRESIAKLAELGFLGIFIPPEYGGSGLDTVSYALIIEELSRACAATGVIVSAHSSLCCYPLLEFGTEEQKQKYLIPLAKGEAVGAFALTEPEAGSDAASQRTVAVPDGDDYILNGSKIFITNAMIAKVFIVFCLDRSARGRARHQRLHPRARHARASRSGARRRPSASAGRAPARSTSTTSASRRPTCSAS